MRWIVAALLVVCVAGLGTAAQARVVSLTITADQPAFGGQSFGDTGPYRRVTAVVHGEIDPADPQDALIQDLWLAPRNAHGRVDYQADLDLLVPRDLARGNRVLLIEVPNRGNKLAPGFFTLGLPPGAAARNALADPGDGFLLRQGFSLAWFGWEADLQPGEGRLRLQPVIARHSDGSPITGVVRMEISTTAAAADLPLSARADTLPPTAYPAARLDNATPDAGGLPSLTVRAHAQDPRVAIPAADWHFGACDAAAGAADPTRVCLRDGFQPGRLYELIYRARDPLVLGLGFAAARDIGAFLRNARADDAGQPNPAYQPNQVAIIEGSSQSGRFIRSFLQLGFNQAEAGGRVFDGAFAHIAAGLLPLNVRFGQPHRNGGDQSDHDFPSAAFPFSYLHQLDPLTSTSAGLLDRCVASATCPRLFHVATSLEFWELRQSLGLTDPLGRTDQPDPPGVRTFVLASTQHVPAAPGALPGHCQQQPNPNPQSYTLRALLLDLAAWVRDETPPPASAVPHLSDGTLVAGDEVRFPPIPAAEEDGTPRPAIPPILPTPTPLHVLSYGPRYDSTTLSGIIDHEPPNARPGDYGVRVPQVDADGNDLAGIRTVFLQVPIGTYTGWNLNRAGWFEGGLCHLHGSFLPFAATRAERLQNGDPRPSIAERYPDKAAYVDAIRHAAASLNAQRFLLSEDMQRVIEQAEHDGIRSAP